MTTLTRRGCVAALIALAAPRRSIAQQGRLTRLVIPYAPGGPTDTSARILADNLKSFSTFVVENRPGAGGAIAGDYVRRSSPDGGTLGVMVVDELAINPWLQRRNSQPERPLVPITLLASVPNVLVISRSAADRLKVDSLADLISYGKRAPGQLTYASGGFGSIGHVLGEMLKSEAGFDALHVPYHGGQPAQVALLASQVDFAFNTLPTWAEQIKSGLAKALAVTSATREPLLSEVPTFGEVFQGFEAETWWGLMAPAGTSPSIIEGYNRAFVGALNDATVRKRFQDLMIRPSPRTPTEFADLISREKARYEKLVSRLGSTAN